MNWKILIAKIQLDQSGASAIEYALILAMIAIGWVVTLTSVADATISMWDLVSTRVSDALGN